MKIHPSFLILLLTFAFACSDKDGPKKTCSFENPIEELPWLASAIETKQSNAESAKTEYVSQAEYNHETIFIFGNCCAYCNYVIQVFNCEGDSIGTLGYEEGSIDISLLDNDVLVWKSSDSVCEF